MREVIQNELVVPINPMDVLERPFEVSEMFCNYLNEHSDGFRWRVVSFRNSMADSIHREKTLATANWSWLHVGKLDAHIFDNLTQMGLAERIDDYWYKVENKTAGELMFFLTSVVANIIDYQPVTDRMDRGFLYNVYTHSGC